MIVLVAVGAGFLLYWALPGQLAWVGREAWASATLKWVVVAAVVATLLAALDRARSVGAVVVVGVLALIPSAIAGGFHRQVEAERSVLIADSEQPAYGWRQPWATAAASALSKAGNVVGDIDTATTTYLPGQDAYSTPVVARGFVTGYEQVVTQRQGRSTAQVCSFDRQVPRPGGMFGYSLLRAVARVGADLRYSDDDVWAYCDADERAHLVVPVTRYTGFPESHPVPAGVVVFDGDSPRLIGSVAPGELPGPVYPMSLAAMQRASTVAADGWWAKFRNRAGYETTSGTYDGSDGSSTAEGSETDAPDAANPSELLLARDDGDGWDYVTALTPRGASASVVAVATVSADQVVAGRMNPVDLYELDEARLGNRALAQEIESAFPEVNWRANGLTVQEVLPTSGESWTATISNATAPTRRVEARADGVLCLTSLSLDVIRCTNEDAPRGDVADLPVGSQPGTAEPDWLTSLDDADLVDLQRAVSDEIAQRLAR